MSDRKVNPASLEQSQENFSFEKKEKPPAPPESSIDEDIPEAKPESFDKRVGTSGEPLKISAEEERFITRLREVRHVRANTRPHRHGAYARPLRYTREERDLFQIRDYLDGRRNDGVYAKRIERRRLYENRI